VSVLALDIGSSRIKALLAGWDGRLIEVRTAGTPHQSLEPGERSYPVDAVLEALEGLVAGLAASHPDQSIDTLVFACLGTAMAPVDRDNRPLGPALAPADRRPQTPPWRLDALGLGADELRRRTGSDPSVASFLLHALWWQEAHPDVMAQLHRFRSLRGYTLAQLCGADAEDVTWASRTMLADLETNDWSEELLSAADLSREVMPPLLPPTATFAVLPEATARLGLAAGARVVLGAMDNCCALRGAAGADRSGLVNIVGTYEHMAGAASLGVARQAAAEADAVIHAYLSPGRYITMTRVPLGELLGRAASGSGTDLDALLDGLSTVPSGRSLALETDAVDAALAAGASRGTVLQALVESATAVVGRFTHAWAAQGMAAEPIVVVGGGARHPAVRQLKANLLGRSLVALQHDESAGLGALRLAAMAVEGATLADACRLFDNPVTTTIRPATAAELA
jgi:xylulokinase